MGRFFHNFTDSINNWEKWTKFFFWGGGREIMKIGRMKNTMALTASGKWQIMETKKVWLGQSEVLFDVNSVMWIRTWHDGTMCDLQILISFHEFVPHINSDLFFPIGHWLHLSLHLVCYPQLFSFYYVLIKYPLISYLNYKTFIRKNYRSFSIGFLQKISHSVMLCSTCFVEKDKFYNFTILIFSRHCIQ